MNTSAPQRRAATAWFAPFPPNPRSNLWPKMVSPGCGNRSANVVRSMLALPTTATLGRADIIYSESASERRVYLACLIVSIDIATGRSLTVRNPNIFHLSGVLQEPSAFPLLRVKPVNGAAFVGKYLFQIPNRK